MIAHGDPAAEGEVAVEGTYETGIQDQAFLGPESGLAVPDGEGGIDIYVATQWLHVDRAQIAPCLDLPPDRVRVHLAGVGGAFGGREDVSMQIHAALLALHTNRAVKIVYSREESFTGHVHRHPSKTWARHTAAAGRPARQRRDAHPPRRRRLRVELDGRLRERRRLRLRPLRRPECPARGDGRLHEQPALRRDARLRRRPDLLRRRGADGPARREARARPGRAAAAERPRDRATSSRPASGSSARCRPPR